MSNRPQVTLRTSLSRLAVAGAATLASVITIAPPAAAADEPTSAEPNLAGEVAADDTPPAEPSSEQPPAANPPAPEPQPVPEEREPVESPPESVEEQEPDATDEAPVAEAEEEPVAEAVEAGALGFQTFRVGVRIAEGTYVPEGTTAAGSTFEIAYTDAEGSTTYQGCTIEGEPDADGITFCPAGTFLAPAGTTVAVRQTSAPSGLDADPGTMTLDTCESTEPEPCRTTDVVFSATGAAPTPLPDAAATPMNTPVVVDVLGNDTGVDPTKSIEVAGVPAHGSAEVIEEDGRQKIRYTPDTDYNGRDTFSYTVTDRNGSATATVGIEVGEVEPIYGSQKYRVGVRIASGSYVAPGTTPVGSELSVTTTLSDGTSTTFTCTTTPFILSPSSSESLCDGRSWYSYIAPAGATVTVVQTTAAPGLVASNETLTLPPCAVDECGTGLFDSFLVFDNTGPLPVAVDDAATTDEGEPVRIDVLANDDSTDPATTLSVASRPGDGDAKVIGQADRGPTAMSVPSAGTQAITYTPDKNFSGVDTFDYALTNRNGTTTATVTVEVVDGEVVPADDADVAVDKVEASEDADLPDTGGADARLLGLAGLLVAMGGWLTAHGRRRHDVHTG